MALAGNQWIAGHQNILITGPTGVGKSYLACALGHTACRDGHVVLYQRLPRLLHDLPVARHDGRYKKRMAVLFRADLLILDDFGITPVTAGGLRDLLEILEDRYKRRSTVVTSQVPVSRWHEALGDPTMADAILDRLVHNAHKIELKGESMRKISASVDKPKAL
jgi:DNA replication protein DnaC